MNVYKLIMFIVYFAFVTGIGVYFFLKNKDKSGKDYFLGGRKMNGFVAALSAGASDMSAWVLMGLPGAIYIAGLGQLWISIGLLIGTVLAWIFVAPRLRKFAIRSNDAITIPEYLSNRFNSKSSVLRFTCAVIFLIGYCLYAASSIAACGTVIVTIIPEANKIVVEIIAAVVIVGYTFLGGFNAVCWTDFFQGMLMLLALMAVPIITFIMLSVNGAVAPVVTEANYYNLLSSGSFDWNSISDILSGIGWGLGYFGMPHILVRFMSIRSSREMKKSQIIGSVWTGIILLMATLVALVAHEYLGNSVSEDEKSSVFIILVDTIFSNGGLAIIGGILLSAIIAASMSTADSQLLLSSSAFAADIYKSSIKKNASDKEILWIGRIAVIVILLFAMLIAVFVSSDIMSLVSAAWSIFGAAFGPVILLSLYWKRFNYKGAVAGIISGALTSILWLVFFNLPYYGFDKIFLATNLYEIVPGFIIGLATAICVTLLTKAPDKETEVLFDEAIALKDEEPEN